MSSRLATALAVVGAACVAASGAVEPREQNYWPFWVEQSTDLEGISRWSSLGPLIFGSKTQSGDQLYGARPLFHHFDEASGSDARSFLYPLWYREFEAEHKETRWTVFNLINSQSGSGHDDRFSVWPFYFSRDTGEPDTSYRAVFPIYGDITSRFGQNRLQWILFPLYARYENDGEITTATPWPFVKTVSGEGHRGFEFWPIAGYREETGVSSRQFMLWPLIYNRHFKLDTDEPSHQAGILPFYATETSAGYRSETFGWPFFGYSDRTSPTTFRATNYLWPLWVQGRGESRYVNRWGPFYSHSVSPSRTQTWVLWPLWRDRQWTSTHLHHQRHQLLYFVYHQEKQTSLQSPDLDAAVKRHVWPLLSYWNNGAGRVQFQTLSPLDVFFPYNERMRQLWSPLFSLYRYNQPAPGEFRHSFLWDALTYAESRANQYREFHLGPLFGYTRTAEGQRWDLLAGVINFEKTSDGAFSASTAKPSFGRR